MSISPIAIRLTWNSLAAGSRARARSHISSAPEVGIDVPQNGYLGPLERESSPGWTRTNNPPVNSRMLCQLSYRGRKPGHFSRARRESGEFTDRRPDLRESLLELDQALLTGLGQLALNAPLPEPQEHL